MKQFRLGRFAAVAWLVLLIATCAWASFTLVQSGPYGTNPTTTDTLPSAQTAGDTILVVSNWCTNSSCNGSTTCGGFNVYDQQQENQYRFDAITTGSSNPGCNAIASAGNIVANASSNQIHAFAETAGGNNYQNVYAIEVSGLGTAPVLEGYAMGNLLTQTSIATGASCTAGDFAWAWFSSGTQPTVGSGWTQIGTPANGGLAEWQTVASTGTVTATTASGAGGLAMVACYKPNSSGFRVVNVSPQGLSNLDTTFTNNSAAGNSIFTASSWCQNSSCTAAACTVQAMSDNAGSVGGSGNNTYINDFGTTASHTGCWDAASASNIKGTTGTVKLTGPFPAGYNYPGIFATEVNATLTLDANSGIQNYVSSFTMSCTAGDIAYYALYGPSNHVTPSGPGWTYMGGKGIAFSDSYLAAWEVVPTTGTITINSNTAYRAFGACYTTSSPTPPAVGSARHRILQTMLLRIVPAGDLLASRFNSGSPQGGL